MTCSGVVGGEGEVACGEKREGEGGGMSTVNRELWFNVLGLYLIVSNHSF